MELGRGNAINRLKIDLDALRDQLRATEQDLAVNTTAWRLPSMNARSWRIGRRRNRGFRR